MLKTTPLQNAIIAASIIGSILGMYDHRIAKERTRAVGVLQSRIKKFLFSRSRTNKKEFNEAVEIADAAWGKTIKFFHAQKLQMETVTAIVEIYELYDKELARFVNIHEKQMDNYTIGADEDVPLEIEKSSRVVIGFMLDEISKATQVKRRSLNLIAQTQRMEVI